MPDIDIDMLSRDYVTFPLKRGKSSRYRSVKGEIPSYDDIYYLYITLNLNLAELSTFFNRKRDSALLWISHHKIIKSTELIQSKMKETKLQIYNNENYNNFNKGIDTRNIKYGKQVIGDKVRNFWNNLSVEDREQLINKRKETTKKNCGYDNYMKNPQFLETFLNGIRFKQSKPELEMAEYFRIIGIEFKSQFVLRFENHTKVYDFFLPKFNLLLEYDGEFWHRLPHQIENDKLKNLIAFKCGYKLARINGYKNLNIKWDIQEN